MLSGVFQARNWKKTRRLATAVRVRRERETFCRS